MISPKNTHAPPEYLPQDDIENDIARSNAPESEEARMEDDTHREESRVAKIMEDRLVCSRYILFEESHG